MVVSQRYRIIQRIARGGMGEVYLAQHEELDQRVAVKLLYPRFASDEKLAQRFFNEARSASRVNHPYAVTMYDFGQLDDGTFYIVMEYIKGRSLSQVVRREGPLHPSLAIRLCLQLCEVLGAAHEQQLIHRDIKPDNIMVIEGAGGRYSVKVLDFGIAKMIDDEHAGNLTQTGMTFGTPEYMSPEQASGRDIDFRTDIYSLGVVFFYMLLGHPPFRGKNKLQLLQRHLHEEPPRVTEASGVRLPTGLTALLARTTAKNPDERPQTMAEFLRELERILPQLPPPPEASRRPAREVVAAARSSRKILERTDRETHARDRRSGTRDEAGPASFNDRNAREGGRDPAPLRRPEGKPTTDLSLGESDAQEPSDAWELGTSSSHPASGQQAVSRTMGLSAAAAKRGQDDEPNWDIGGFEDEPDEDWQLGAGTDAFEVGDFPDAAGLSSPPATTRGAQPARMLVPALIAVLLFGGIVAAFWAASGGLPGASEEVVEGTDVGMDAPGEAADAMTTDVEDEDSEHEPAPPAWAEDVEEAREDLYAGRIDRVEGTLNRIASEEPTAAGHGIDELRDDLREFREMQAEVESHLAEGRCRAADNVVVQMRGRFSSPVAARFYGSLDSCRNAQQAAREQAQEREAAEERRRQQEAEAEDARRAREEAEAERRRQREAEERRQQREREERQRPPSSL